MGAKKAVATAFILILLIAAAYYTGWLDIILEAFTGMRLKEIFGERMEDLSILSVRLVKVRDAPRSYTYSMKVVEYEVWHPEEQRYIYKRRPCFEGWSFYVFPFKNDSWQCLVKHDNLNWTVANVNGREMLIVTVPANHTLIFRREIAADNLTVSRNLWVRVDVCFLSGPVSPIFIEPPFIKKNPRPWLFYVVATNPVIFAEDILLIDFFEYHLLISPSLWEYKRCIITATLEDFAHTSVNLTEYAGCGVGGDICITIPPGYGTPFIGDVWPRRNYTVALTADFLEPDAILEVEVMNGRQFEIISLIVKIGSEIITAKPRDFIKKGEKYVFRIAPTGTFKVGEVYNVTVTALYWDLKKIEVTKQVVRLIDHSKPYRNIQIRVALFVGLKLSVS